MAIDLASQPAVETPEKVVVSDYGVKRLGLYPQMYGELSECVSVKDEAGLPQNGVFGSVAYRHVHIGRIWRIVLDSSNPEAFNRMVQAQQSIAKKIATGMAPDTANAQEVEALENERRAGNLTYAIIEGNAP